MAPSTPVADYYAVLEISRTADETTIKASYRRLARLHHPDKNRNDPRATAQFQAIEAAYSTLSDRQKRRAYDMTYTPQAVPPKSQPDTADAVLEKKIADLQKSMKDIETTEGDLLTMLADATREFTQSQSVLGQLQKQEAEDAALMNGWYFYIFGLSPGVKEELERRAVERRAARRVRETKLGQAGARMEGIRASIDGFERRRVELAHHLVIVQGQLSARRRMAEEQRRQASEEKQRKEAAERAARLRREAQEREERARKLREEIQRKEDELREVMGAARREMEKNKQHQEENVRWQRVRCSHKAWWVKEHERGVCERCEGLFGFLLRCPGCDKKACASCCNHLKRFGG